MSAPVLNRKLVLEDPVQVPDGAGGFNETWVPLGILWAEVKAGTGQEKAGEFITVSKVPYRITVRGAPYGAPSRPKPEQRFREGTRLFRIKAVTERDPQAHFLTCFAYEEVSS
jgi:head-tail adaptor